MSDKEKIDPLALVAKLGEEERRLSEGTFLAPVVDGGRVRVRVQGIIYDMSVADRFEGWAILRMSEPGKASVVEQASPAMVGRYLKLFPRIRLVLLMPSGKYWWALAASTGDKRFDLKGPVPVQLVERASRFDTINCRFDGSTFWFESLDRKRDPAVSKTLSKALNDATEPKDLRCSGAVPQEKLAYTMLWLAEHQDQLDASSDVARIGNALRHAGAQLEGFWYQEGDQATVRFTIDGTSRTVVIHAGDLSIMSAGVCLSGRERDFDLASLVGVLREASQQGFDDDY